MVFVICHPGSHRTVGTVALPRGANRGTGVPTERKTGGFCESPWHGYRRRLRECAGNRAKKAAMTAPSLTGPTRTRPLAGPALLPDASRPLAVDGLSRCAGARQKKLWFSSFTATPRVADESSAARAWVVFDAEFMRS
jgi:hypothetical protein